MKALALLILSALPLLAAAQERYPVRPVRLASAGSPGTALDIVARIYAEKLAQRLGQQVIVENRSGAGGTIASNALAKSAPDGYSLLVVNNAHAINATLYPALPYDSLKDFAAVALLADSPAIVAVSPQLGARTLKELVALARDTPGSLNFGSGGVGTSVHIVGEYFAAQAGIRLVHVPYKTVSELNADLISGRIQLTFGPVAFHLAHIRAGRHVPLAVTSKERIALLPELPTVSEAGGLAGFEYGTWYGLIAPANTPQSVLGVLAAEVLHANEEPDVRERMAAQGLVPKRMVLGDYDHFIRSEIDKLGRIVKASGAKVD